MSQEDDEKREFQVVDKRHGREEGEAPEPAEPPSSPPPPEPKATAAAPPGPGQGPDLGPREMPAMDFSTFLISLSTSALFHMGLVAEREGEPPPPANLPMARQTIDILEMIQEKTQGNLNDEEAHLFESLLYELRMRFVEVQRG
jgi:hypothetical protein